MNDAGFWINARTDKYCRIDEHALWITNPVNAEKLHLSHEVIAAIKNLNWQTDRLEILLRVMEDGCIRVRDHGDYITFEFTMPTEEAIVSIGRFLDETELAGPLSELRITNLKAKSGLRLHYTEFMNVMQEEEASIAERCRPVKNFAYPESEIDHILERTI